MNRNFNIQCEFVVCLVCFVFLFVVCFNIHNLDYKGQIISIVIILVIVSSVFMLSLLMGCITPNKKEEIVREIEMIEIIVYNPDDSIDVGVYKTNVTNKK